MSMKTMARFYTVAQVADLLGVSSRSVRRWIAESDLRAHRFGRQVRISETDLRRMLEKASGYSDDVVPLRFIVNTRHAAERWEVIVEPDEGLELLVVVTAYPVR